MQCLPNLISIVVPIYQNELNIPVSIPHLIEVGRSIGNYELILVDDGSHDRSYELLVKMQQQYPDVIRIVKLSRNFGQIIATRAGLAFAKGDVAIIISADLQEPPELISEMITHWRSGYKLVLAEREARADRGFFTLASMLYWKLVGAFALEGYPTGGFDFCLLDRQIIDDINNIKERNTQIFPLIFSLGYTYKKIPYTRSQRNLGVSQWTLLKKIKLFIDTFIAFSYLPIRLVTLFGILASILSVIFMIYLIIDYSIHGSKILGWSSLAVLISGFGGLTLFSLGILGEYLWRILDQVRQRPLFVVEKIHELKSNEDGLKSNTYD